MAATVSHELSYMQIKASAEARQTDEAKWEHRKRNMIVLILNHLRTSGYMESAEKLEAESHVSLKRFDVCDNVDLMTILQEFESFYSIKYNRPPKLVKKLQVAANGSDLNYGSEYESLAARSLMKAIPPIPPVGRAPREGSGGASAPSSRNGSGGGIGKSLSESDDRPSAAAFAPPSAPPANVSSPSRTSRSMSLTSKPPLPTAPAASARESGGKDSGSNKKGNAASSGGRDSPLGASADGMGMGMGLTVTSMASSAAGGAVAGKAKGGSGHAQQQAPQAPQAPEGAAPGSVARRAKYANGASGDAPLSAEDRLLKPLPFANGWNSEMRELAQVISRDIFSDNPNVHWSDIIGLDAPKRLVKEAVVYPIKYPELFQGILSPWKGLLLYGPPGTGKTMLAKAVATECGTTFFNISASSIVSKWRGDSEKLVRCLFELARYHAPSTIFLDELEAIMSQRAGGMGGGGGGGGEHEGSLRMKTELLIQMDGLARSNDLVFVLAASNLPWELDPAMLRRLEKRILVGLPCQDARRAMFESHLPRQIGEGHLAITTELDYESLGRQTEGYSGSDIRLVCKEAAMRPLRRVFDVLENAELSGEGGLEALGSLKLAPIENADVDAAIASTKPSARLLVDKYVAWQKEYESV